MATKFTVKQASQKPTSGGHYVMEREFKKEARKVAELEKKLEKHEKTDMAHAHPMRRSHEASQKAAPLPNMRSY